MEQFVHSERRGAVALLTIDRPEALNALNETVLEQLDAAIRAAGADPEVGALVITGAGDRAFVAGADVTRFRDMNPQEARRFARFGQAVFNRIEELPKPVIAAVNGYALGGGCELALACDLRLASERARFGQPEINLGLVPGWGGTQRLARLVGAGRAKELIFTGEWIDAAEALRIGLANAVHPAGELLPRALDLAGRLAAKARLTLGLAKEAVNQGARSGLTVGLAYEAELFSLAFATADQKEGVAAFLEKRVPRFQGR